MKYLGILISISSTRLAFSTSLVIRNYTSILKLSKFVNKEFLALVNNNSNRYRKLLYLYKEYSSKLKTLFKI
jgi:hypothetical protein